jgi:hypothetical protein
VRRNATHICVNLVNCASCVGMVPPRVLFIRCLRYATHRPPQNHVVGSWGQGPNAVDILTIP